MSILFTTTGDDLNAPMDERFGRAEKFLIYDLEHNTFSVVDNKQNLNAAQGAGIQSAQRAVNLGVSAVITGHCGPKAFRVLAAAGITIYLSPGATVGQALELFRSGSLVEAKSANVEGHWA